MKDGKFTYYRVIFLARTRDISELFCSINLEFAKRSVLLQIIIVWQKFTVVVDENVLELANQRFSIKRCLTWYYYFLEIAITGDPCQS